MNHSFNTEIAKDIGLVPAVMLEHIAFWILKNEANEKNFFDGAYWTYSSVDGFAKIFDYLTAKQIRSALEKLIETGYLVTGNYNKSTYDRTKWYALTAKSRVFYGLSNCQKRKMDLPKKANGSDKKGKPIPDINKDIKTPYIPQTGESSEEENPKIEETLETSPLDKQKQNLELPRQKNKQVDVQTSQSVPPAAVSVIDYLNERTGKSYRPVKANLRLVCGRLKEGYTVDDLRRVIDLKTEAWGEDEKMREYLRPATLFGALNFAQYSAEPVRAKKEVWEL